jgi:ABC-type nitrate/sulfonate/bicarbonate transport system substrate-binding protein
VKRYRTLFAQILGIALVVAAGGGDTGATPTTTGPTPTTSDVTETTSDATATTQGTTETTQGDDPLADIRGRIEGQSVVIGSSAFPNSSVVGAFRTVAFLEEVFGVDVDFRLLDSDPLVAATIAGEVQVGQLSLAGMADSVSVGSDFIAFGGDDQKNTFLVAAKAPVASMEELSGQPFAITQSLNQITGQTAQKCLDDVGMTIDDVQLIRLGNTGETTQALASDQVVGAISATFRLTQLILDEGEGVYNILCRGWESNPQISSVWYAERAWVDENPDMALAINIASVMSARWTAEDKDRWVEYATSVVEGLTPEAASIDYDTLVGELDNWPVNGSLDRELMQQTLDTSFEFEAIDRQYNVDEVATFEFQDEAVSILGDA